MRTEYMYIILILLLSTGCVNSKITETKNVKNPNFWLKSFGTEIANEEAEDVIVLNNNYLILANRERNDFTDILILKLDKYGNKIFEKTIGEKYILETGYSIVKINNNKLIIVGSKETFSGNEKAYILIIDDNGNILHEKSFAKPNSAIKLITVKQFDNNHFMAIGNISKFSSNRNINKNNYKKGIYLIKFDHYGKKVWDKEYYIDNTNSFANGLVIDKDKNIIFSGGLRKLYKYGSGHFSSYIVKLNEEGKNIWHHIDKYNRNRTYDLITEDSNLFQVGVLFNGDSDDAFIKKISKDKVSRTDTFLEKYGGKMLDAAYSIDKINRKEFYITGITKSFGNNQSDMYVLKISNDGKKVWEKNFGGKKGEAGNAIKVTNDKGAIIVGGTRSFSNSKKNIFVVRINKNGNFD